MIPDKIINELNQAFLDFTSHSDSLSKNIGDSISNIGVSIREIITKEIPQILREVFDEAHYKIKGSVGQGRQTATPWVAIMDKDITTSTQKGVYIVFLVETRCTIVNNLTVYI